MRRGLPIVLIGLIAGLRSLSGEIALFSHGHFGLVQATRWLGLAETV